VRVPDDAGLGKAKVTFSFAGWKDGRVAPGTIELPVVAVSEKKADGK
jgi:hypothetical protein